MAGFIMSLNSEEALKECIESGIYSTILKDPKNNVWAKHHEGTFADYFGMKEGDNIYFFIKRKIYGVGELININGDCKYWNYIGAEKPQSYKYKDVKKLMLLDDKSNIENRCICVFKPSPNFFKNGIDMDDVLSSNPMKFRMLRAFWKLSFIKVDDEENEALKSIILKRNEEHINKNDGSSFEYNEKEQKLILNKVNESYKMNSRAILEYCIDGKKIKHEMAIESALLDILSNKKNTIFGHWDYISHQVIASPFKAIDYMDKMDVFGYRYIKGYNIISKYLVIELKKDLATKDAVDQVMKYVDWINSEYAYGDYGMIQAFIVASDFSKEVIEYRDLVCVRNYTKGKRPTVSAKWNFIKLIKYEYENSKLIFSEVNKE